MNPAQPVFSVTEPLSPAFTRVKTVLFSPFNLGRWLTIAFCAWLATLGESGLGGGNFNWNTGGDHQDWQREFSQAREWVTDNLHWLVPVVVVLALVAVIVWLVFLWLSSRGWFMFLHCVAENRAEVAVPWSRYAAHANSLALFRLIVSVVSGLTIVVPIIAAVFLGIGLFAAGAGPLAVVGLVLALLVIIAIGIGWAVINKFTCDFVTPLMARYTTSAWEGWRRTLALIRPRLGLFVLYVLLQIVIKLAIVALVLASCLITCCVAGCLMLLPYVGTVVLLPALVFERAYPLCFLRQFGEGFDFLDQPIQPQPAPAPAA